MITPTIVHTVKSGIKFNAESTKKKVRNKMAEMQFDEEGFLNEPCLSCDKAYLEDIWYEWCCDEKKCPYKAESEVSDAVSN